MLILSSLVPCSWRHRSLWISHFYRSTPEGNIQDGWGFLQPESKFQPRLRKPLLPKTWLWACQSCFPNWSNPVPPILVTSTSPFCLCPKQPISSCLNSCPIRFRPRKTLKRTPPLAPTSSNPDQSQSLLWTPCPLRIGEWPNPGCQLTLYTLLALLVYNCDHPLRPKLWSSLRTFHQAYQFLSQACCFRIWKFNCLN